MGLELYFSPRSLLEASFDFFLFKEGFNSLKITAKNIAVKYHLEICGKADIKRDLGIPIWKAYDKETCSLLTWHAFLFLVPPTAVFL